MKYAVTIAGRTFEVDVAEDVVRVNGATRTARLGAVPASPLYHLVTDRAARTYAMRCTTEGWVVERGGESWVVQVVDERARRLERFRERSTGREGAGTIRAPMPGLVLRIEVQPGQAVTTGTGLVVLEAMKMENEIRAPGAGTVRAVLVEPGQAVEKGAPLVEIS